MKVNFVYSDLNPCGGAEKFSLVTMRAFLKMGFEIDLTSLEFPDRKRLEMAFGYELVSVMDKVKKINILDIFDSENISRNVENGYDLTINTHGDLDPYYHTACTKKNTMTYCHFPSAKRLIESENEEYFGRYLRVDRMENTINSYLINQQNLYHNNQVSMNSFNLKSYVEWLRFAYEAMIRNSTLITNSKYSQRAIHESFGINGSLVIFPPVDVNTFREESLIPSIKNKCRIDSIIVVCRIDPSKKIERALQLAKVLKGNNIASEMIIIGNLDPFFYNYYSSLREMVIDYDLTDYVKFEINITLSGLIEHLKTGNILFHPKDGEHFGMSIVEGISAGLIPIVPSIGGQTEYVPHKYQYSTLNEAAIMISKFISTADSERLKLSDSMNQFSTEIYDKKIQLVTKGLLTNA